MLRPGVLAGRSTTTKRPKRPWYAIWTSDGGNLAGKLGHFDPPGSLAPLAGSLYRKEPLFFLLFLFLKTSSTVSTWFWPVDCPGRSGAPIVRYAPENVDGISLDRAMRSIRGLKRERSAMFIYLLHACRVRLRPSRYDFTSVHAH